MSDVRMTMTMDEAQAFGAIMRIARGNQELETGIRKVGAAERETAKETKNIEREQQQWLSRIRTPLEQHQKDIERLKQIKEKTKMTEAEFARAVEHSAERMRRLSGEEEKAAAATRRLDQAQQQWLRAIESPLERHNRKIAELNMLRLTGKQTQDEYNRSVAVVKQEYAAAEQAGQKAFGPMMLGSLQSVAGILAGVGVTVSIAGGLQKVVQWAGAAREEVKALAEGILAVHANIKTLQQVADAKDSYESLSMQSKLIMAKEGIDAQQAIDIVFNLKSLDRMEGLGGVAKSVRFMVPKTAAQYYTTVTADMNEGRAAGSAEQVLSGLIAGAARSKYNTEETANWYTRVAPVMIGSLGASTSEILGLGAAISTATPNSETLATYMLSLEKGLAEWKSEGIAAGRVDPNLTGLWNTLDALMAENDKYLEMKSRMEKEAPALGADQLGQFAQQISEYRKQEIEAGRLAPGATMEEAYASMQKNKAMADGLAASLGSAATPEEAMQMLSAAGGADQYLYLAASSRQADTINQTLSSAYRTSWDQYLAEHPGEKMPEEYITSDRRGKRVFYALTPEAREQGKRYSAEIDAADDSTALFDEKYDTSKTPELDRLQQARVAEMQRQVAMEHLAEQRIDLETELNRSMTLAGVTETPITMEMAMKDIAELTSLYDIRRAKSNQKARNFNFIRTHYPEQFEQIEPFIAMTPGMFGDELSGTWKGEFQIDPLTGKKIYMPDPTGEAEREYQAVMEEIMMRHSRNLQPPAAAPITPPASAVALPGIAPATPVSPTIHSGTFTGGDPLGTLDPTGKKTAAIKRNSSAALGAMTTISASAAPPPPPAPIPSLGGGASANAFGSGSAFGTATVQTDVQNNPFALNANTAALNANTAEMRNQRPATLAPPNVDR